MHVDVIRNHQTAADGSQREYLSKLLRRSYRDEQGRPRKETLANLSALPDSVIDDLRRLLKGETLVSASTGLAIERSLSHGDVALVHAMASKLGLKELLGSQGVARSGPGGPRDVRAEADGVRRGSRNDHHDPGGAAFQAGGGGLDRRPQGTPDRRPGQGRRPAADVAVRHPEFRGVHPRGFSRRTPDRLPESGAGRTARP